MTARGEGFLPSIPHSVEARQYVPADHLEREATYRLHAGTAAQWWPIPLTAAGAPSLTYTDFERLT